MFVENCFKIYENSTDFTSFNSTFYHLRHLYSSEIKKQHETPWLLCKVNISQVKWRDRWCRLSYR